MPRLSCTLFLALVGAGCHSAPGIFTELPDPLPRLAAVEALQAVPSSLTVGDRLEFEWTSTLGGAPESATCVLEVVETGAAKRPRSFTASEVGGLARMGAALGRELGLPVAIDVVDEDRCHGLPAGGHAISLAMRLPDGSTTHRELILPIACEGRGLLTARTQVQSMLAQQRPVVDLDGLFELLFSMWAPFMLTEAEQDMRRLPGVDLAMVELADMPSMFRSFFNWMGDQPLELEFPFWQPWPTPDGRFFVPVNLEWGGTLLVKGYVELAPARGLLAATSGIIGLHLHRPSDPQKSLSLRLVRSVRAVG
ncbi:MAG: hypothetical protein KDC98_15900 [Planctomycetes bacterium]|nr:hypothetical protein [Planctomycetota bacterium]